MPFTGSIQLFKNIFNKTILSVHGLRSVVWPATFVEHVAVCALAGDDVVHVAPQVLVNCVNVGSSWVSPTLGSLWAGRVWCPAAQIFGIRIVVRVAGQHFSLTIYQELLVSLAACTSG